MGKQAELFVVVGLGNPGSKYMQTWHNLGFMALEWLSQKHDLPIRVSKHKACTARGQIEGQPVLLACPQTFMNLSGESVAEIVRFYKIPTQNVLVIYDDLDLGVGEVRMRASGGPGTHNGMRSVIQHLGTEDFPRIRLGFGPKRGPGDLADFVLSTIPKQEQELVFQSFEKAGNGVALWLKKGVEAAMNELNRKPKPPKPPKSLTCPPPQNALSSSAAAEVQPVFNPGNPTSSAGVLSVAPRNAADFSLSEQEKGSSR